MAIEWVVGIAVLSLLVGFGVAWFFNRYKGGQQSRVVELEQALEASREELSSYRRDVYGQFSDTADKFRALDQSYHDLHRQLAQSAVALCGDAATPLLENTTSERLVAESEDITSTQPAPSAEQPTGLDGVPEPGLGVTDTIVVAEAREREGDEAEPGIAKAAEEDDEIPTLNRPTDEDETVETQRGRSTG